MTKIAAFGLVVLLAATGASAQQTASAQDPAQSGAQTASRQPGFMERIERIAEGFRIAERLSPENGPYPRIGDLTTGSGFSIGPGYRQHLFGDRLFVDVSGVISVKNYRAADVKTRWLRAWDERVELWTNFRYNDFPEEDFFGLGLDSRRDARTSYTLISTDVNTVGVVRIGPLRVGADVGYFNPRITRGEDDHLPSIEERFTDREAPGLAAQPDFLHHSVFLESDTRDTRGNPRRGGFYRASYTTWDDRPLQQFNFGRLDLQASQFVPLVNPDHIAAFRVGMSFLNNAGGDRVPFYFLPYVGGSNTVRGFREFRFRDENALFLNVEYRWHAFPFLQIAPFFDAGEVRRDWAEIGLGGLETSYGIGVRALHGSRVFFRLDVATGGGEGTQVHAKFRRSF